MTSTSSGTGVTSGAAGISGRVAADAGNQAVLAGTIGEVGGGQYRANLFASDVSGNCLGFLFTASGCVPVSFTVITQNNVSGKLIPQSGLTYPASGAFVTVPIASVSGINAVVPPSTLSGVFASVPIASISGVSVVASQASGTTFLASGQAVSLNSGQFVNVYSGQLSGQSVVASSGVNAIVPIASISGTTVSVIPSTISGVNAVVPIASISGVNAIVPIASISGVNAVTTIASGTTFLASGQAVSINSGTFVTVPISSISGTNAIVPPASLSGVFASVPIISISGVNAVVPIDSISGVNAVTTIVSGTAFLASGQSVSLNSGQVVGVYSGNLSGQFVTASSGVNAIVPIASISGVNTVVPIASLSGVTVNVPVSQFVNAGLVVTQGNVVSATSTSVTFTPALGITAAFDHKGLVGCLVSVTSDNAIGVKGQPKIITSAAVGSPGEINLHIDSAWDVDPSSASPDQVTIWPNSPADVRLWRLSQPNVLQSGRVDAVVPIALISGVNAVTTIASGTTFLASGSAVNLLSGNVVGVYSGNLSGQLVVASSGVNAIVPPSTLSGVFASVPIASISGVNSVVLPASLSGVNAIVPPASLSGVTASVVPATISGVFASVPIASISGVNAVTSLASGTTFLASGQPVTIAAAVWDRVLTGATHNIPSSAGRRLRQVDAISIIDGTATASATNSITLDGSASATDEIYDGNLIVITGGTGAGQTRVIVEYNGATKVAIVNRVWQTLPSIDSEYEIIANSQADIVQHGLAQGGTASTITLATEASTVDDIYVGSLIYISTSTGTGQTRVITDYNGTTKVATVSPNWVVDPTSSSVYNITPMGRSIVESFSDVAKSEISVAAGVAVASGVVVASGQSINLNSGQFVNVYSGSLSGQQITARTVTDKSGYILANSGLDLVTVESGMNFRQAQSVIAAAAGGQLSGAGTATITIDGANSSGVNRVTASVDGSGNRTTVTLNLPG